MIRILLEPLTGELGIIFQMISSQQLINLIEKLKKEPLGCQQRGEKSRKVYKGNYTLKVCIGKYVQLVNALL